MRVTFWKEFAQLLAEHNHLSGDAPLPQQAEGLRKLGKTCKTVGVVTRHSREEILRQLFKRLFALGFGFDHPWNLKPKHVNALIHDWVKREYSASRIQNCLSALRCFCNWINKGGMIGPTEEALRDAGVSPSLGKRTVAAKTDKSWTAQGIDPCKKILEVAQTDPRIACVLTQQLAFGLRMREASCMKPHFADRDTTLAVEWGTKGGRERTVNIDHEGKRKALDWAKTFTSKANSSLMPEGMLWKNWHNRFYYVCRKHGISRTDEIVPHGLRHQHLNDLYQMLTGKESPVRAATNAEPPEKIAMEYARQVVAEVAGHGRKSASRAYLGQFLPSRGKTKSAKPTA